MGATDIIVQILGLGVSAGLCFMGYVGRGGVRYISVYTATLTAIQSVLLNQPAILAMNLVNLLYYTATLFESKVPFLEKVGYRISAVSISLGTAAYVQYIVLGWGFFSPGTLAILGGATGLLMAIAHSFAALKTYTVLNVICWSSYCILVGSFGNLVGNAFVLVGVAIAVWKHVKEKRSGDKLEATTSK